MWSRESLEAMGERWTERVQSVRDAIRPFRRRIVLFLAVVGPGLIVSNVDNDAGGIYTYAQSGAKYGNAVLWSLIPMTIALYVSLEMCSRMGAFTGKGLSDLIREEFGFRVTFFLMAAILLVNLGNVMAEFTGVFWASENMGVSRFISVPVAAVVVWVLVVQGTAKWVERIFLTFCLIYFSYVISAFLAKPDWLVSLLHLFPPHLIQYVPTMKRFAQVPKFDAEYAVILAALVGTTIAPWQHFYLQAAVVEKRVGPRQYPTTRNDVIVGSVSCMVIVFFIIVCTAATLYVNGIHDIPDAATAAIALRPLAGKLASLLFSIGLLNASLFAASILPLSTSYVVCEALGFESGIDRKFGEAKIFYTLYTALIFVGAFLVLILGKDNSKAVLLWSQVLNGFLLPAVLIFVIILVNRRDLMGDQVNSRGFNWVAWISTIAMIILTLVVAYTSIHDLFAHPAS